MSKLDIQSLSELDQETVRELIAACFYYGE